jgi:hypothetical protein
MNHNCWTLLCDEPHAANDTHVGDCLCVMCHPEHDWTSWSVYPECDGCLAAMELWIYENEDTGLGILYEHFDPVKYETDAQRWRARRAALESTKRGLYEYRKSA